MKHRRPEKQTRRNRTRTRTRRVLRFIWRWGLRPPLVLATLFFAFSWGAKGIGAARSAMMSETERLTEDLERLERLVVLEHPAPFANGNEADVHGALDRARSAIEAFQRGDLAKERVLAHFFEVVASLHDPHTTVAARYDIFGILPVGFLVFDDEVRIVASRDSAALGARVVGFDETPTAEALDRIRRVVPYANESGFRNSAPGYLRSPGLLAHVGVTTDPARVTLTLLRMDGSPAVLALSRVTLDDYRDSLPTPLLPQDGELPRYRRTDRGPNWYEALPEQGALYIRFGSSASSEPPPSELTRRALHVRDSLGLGPVVVDVRGNRGGDPQAHIPLVRALAAMADTRGPENLRVLVDGGTFSAGIVATGDLERRVGGILVGEEPGDLARLTTDPRPFTLRHSGVEVWVPTSRLRTPGGAGGRTRLSPVKAVRPSFEDWYAGRDPTLDAALAHEGPVAPRAETEPPETELPEGRFAFDAQRALTLSRDLSGYHATVTGLGSDDLSPASAATFSGGIHFGLRSDGNGGLARRLPDGTWVALARLTGDAPLELLSSGRLAEARTVYLALTADGADRGGVAALGLLAEGTYRYEERKGDIGRALFTLAGELSPADPLIPLQLSLLRREAEDRMIPPVGEVLKAIGACVRRYRRIELLNDWRLCM